MNDFNLFYSVTNSANSCPFREKILLKMSRNEEINIVVVGGSLTQGLYLYNNSNNSKWSTILSNFLNNGWYSNKINVINIAIGAYSIGVWLHRFEEFFKYDADLIITDFTVNETRLDPTLLEKYYQTFIRSIETLPKSPALLFNLMFALAFKSLAHERIDQGINGYTIDLNQKDLVAYYRSWKISDISRAVLKYHNIPYTNFRDVLYPDFSNPHPNITDIWTGSVHPGARAHKYIGDHIAISFLRLFKDAVSTNKCSTTINGHENPYHICDRKSYIAPEHYDKKARPVCLPGTVTSLMDANTTPESKNSFVMGSDFNETKSKWKFFSDSKSKYGWIYEQDDNSYIKKLLNSNLQVFRQGLKYEDLDKDYILSFDINANTATQIIFLQSYTQIFGNFILWIDENIYDSAIVKTRYFLPFSVPTNFDIFKKLISFHT